MIKNWVVKVEQIKVDSIDRHKKYLLDEKHENHLKSDISTVFSGKSFEKAFAERKERLEKEGKPDRSSYKNYATSFVFGPPIDIQINEKTAKALTGAVVEALADVLGIDKKIMQNYCVSVLHNEKAPKKPHFHFLVSNVVNGQFRKELTQHKAKYAIQKVLDREYKRLFKLDRAEYQPDPNYTHNKPLWLVRMERKQAELSNVLLTWLNDTVERFKIREVEKKEQSKKGLFGKMAGFFKKSTPSPKQVENADKAASGVVETHSSLSKEDQQRIIAEIEKHERQQQVERELLISQKIKAGLAAPVVVDHRTDEEKEQAKANYEKAVSPGQTWSKNRRAKAIRNSKK